MNRSQVRSLIGIVMASTLLLAVTVSAGRAGEFFESGGVAIRGYDPVAYVTQSMPIQGSTRFALPYRGTTFHFVNEANRSAFLANPAAFVPQYGGYCAYGLALGYKAATDPRAFTVVDGKLYLNYDLTVRQLWSKDIPGHIAKADRNWPTVKLSTKVVQ